jgi:hypothetical protein
MATIDIVDYYLGAILPSPESVRIDVSSISIPTLTKLGLLPFLRHSHGKPFLFCDVLKTVPGLPQSGLLSQPRLVALLTQHIWVLRNLHPHAFSPPHPLSFPLPSPLLVVDDFLVHYSHSSELDHLVSCLSSLYELKFIETFLATPTSATPSTIHPPHPSPCMTLSMPSYIPSMLSHLCPSGCGSALSPAVYTPPVSPTDSSLTTPSSTATLSTPVSAAEKTWIQQVVGSLLFYARALDLSLLITAVCQLSSHQSTPTQHDLTFAHRLLNYASSHPNPHKTIHPSSMALWACTDASFLSRPKSGSVAGCSVGLGDRPPYLLHPPPESRRQSWKDKQSLVRASRLLRPTPLISHHPCHPHRPFPCLLPAHTHGGSVCGRGGVCCCFWRWASVG